MNCFDCAALGSPQVAVGTCTGCGAGVCCDHARVDVRWLTSTAALNRTVIVEPPARTIRCPVCHAAAAAARGDAVPARLEAGSY